jgi:putative ABC transport system permease protein
MPPRIAAIGRANGFLWRERRGMFVAHSNLPALDPSRFGIGSGGVIRVVIILTDLKHTLRALRRSPGFSVAVILILGLGIGANTAIFSVVNGVLLRSLPYEEPDRLVRVYTEHRGRTGGANSVANFYDYRERIRSLRDVNAYVYDRWHLEDGVEPRRALVARSSAGLLRLLGCQPALGRWFSPEEDGPGAGSVVVLSHGLWQRSFGGSAEAIGGQVRLQGEPFTVVGVMPRAFEFPHKTVEAWVPLRVDPSDPLARVNSYLRVVGRLSDGVDPAHAQAELSAYAKSVTEEYPENYKSTRFGVSLVSLHEDIVGGTRAPLLALLGAVTFVLLIACANVANLLLSRGEARSREIAIRSALGASTSRLTWQLLAECLVLSLAGGALGLLLAHAGTRVLLRLAGDAIPRLDQITVDSRVLAFTAAAALFSGLLAGFLPSRRVSRSGIQQMLQQAGRRVTGSLERNRSRRLLIVAEVAAAVVVVIGAGIMIRSLAELRRLDTGFRTDDVLTLQVDLPEADYEEGERAVSFYAEMLERVRALPGVDAAAVAEFLPLASRMGRTSLQIEGSLAEKMGEAPVAKIQQVSPGYFEVLGRRFRGGRTFSDRDVAGQPHAGIINEAFAREFLPGGPPLGRRVRMYEQGRPWIEIVGVVEDNRFDGLQSVPQPMLYVPHAQAEEGAYYASRGMALLVHGRAGVAKLTGPVRDLIRGMDRSAAVWRIRTMDRIHRDALAERALPTVLLGAFGGLALALAATGIYAVISCLVSQRTREIGIRMAVGADSGRVRRMVVRQAFLPVATGLALGLIVAWHVTEFLRSLLYNVSPADPVSFAGVVILFAGVALMASYGPAHRASRVDPMTVLRSE